MENPSFIERLKQYKLIFLVGGILIAIFIIISIIILRVTNNTTPQTGVPGTTQPGSEKSVVSVISIFPLPNSSDVSLFPQITATFSAVLTQEQQSNILLLSTPQTEFTKSWSANQKSVSFTPTQPLITNQSYTLTLQYVDKTYSWAFTTVPINKVSTEDQIKNQEIADRDFGEWDKNNQASYPWYNKLPLQTNTYFVYFNLDTKNFVAKIYPSSSTPTESETNAIKSEVLSKLAGLGINTANYSIEWKVIPAP